MTRDPGANENTGDQAGTLWLNTVSSNYWQLTSTSPVYTWSLVGSLLGQTGPAGPSGVGAIPLTQNLTFSPDNTYDIGTTSTNRPRHIYSGGWVIAAGALQSKQGQIALASTNIFDVGSNVLEQRNATSPQTLRIYNTFTDANNYSRLSLIGGGAVHVLLEQAGTGPAQDMRIRNNGNGYLAFGTNAADRWWIGPTGHLGAQTDNTYDIGANGANRPRNAYFAGNVNLGGGLWAIGSLALGPSQDAWLTRDAADTLAMRDIFAGTLSQTFRIYNTYTDASNYERAVITFSGGAMVLGQESSGTGVARSLFLETGSTVRWIVTNTGHLWAQADNTYDIGASGANRPRDIYAARSMGVGFNASGVAGSLTVQGPLSLGNGAAVGLGLWSGSGVPAAGLGANGDIYFRSDGGAGTTMYQKRAGTWTATAA